MRNVTCPSCGAAVEFRSPESLLLVCAHCGSTVLLKGRDLKDLGKMAYVMEDGSPVQLGSRGVYQGRSFTTVGRLQVQYQKGMWNEWFLLFDNGDTAWLGEAQGYYAVMVPYQGPRFPFAYSQLKPGQTIPIDGNDFTVRDKKQGTVIAAEGELPFEVQGGWESPSVDLAGEGAAFATVDYSQTPPLIFVGEVLEFDDLSLTNLREIEGW